MQRLNILLGVVCSLSVWAWTSAAADAPPKAELAALQGTWKMTAGEIDGRAMPAEFLARKETTLVVDGERWTQTVKGGKGPGHAVIKLDPTQSPRQIDLTDVDVAKDEKAETTLGIYEVQGDTLKVCVARPGTPGRPREFRGADKNTLYRVFTRAKAEAKADVQK